ncbi:MAG: hypothetical protein KZQ80_03890 [Candidatus Thiodiazotropha sp. (ex Monitilora ramsayi)]|nr:hypothetical protein [Candidatus Thiodiazotropha sp. (ex Monitilora ramsayi)]
MNVVLRKYPYPYHAVFAICSDLDETPSEKIYFETIRYLNTRDSTMFGKGLGLEVGNTIYFHMPKGQFSYWNCSDKSRENIRSLIKSGHIDCLHSFGDEADTRQKIEACWDELSSHDCLIRVWIDHAQAASNLDTDIMRGKGAVRGSEVYHTDLTFSKSGIEYVWKGRVTSVIAQNTKRSLTGLFNSSHPFKSFKTILTEFVKGLLGSFNNKKYKMHGNNRVLRKTCLHDGTETIEFMRSNPSWGGVSAHEKGRDIGNVITMDMLNRLIAMKGCSILYTHLGKVSSLQEPFGQKALQAFEMLAEKYRNKEILVLTTRRLLDYMYAYESVEYDTSVQNGRVAIKIHTDNMSLEQLSGLTWYVEDPEKVDVYYNKEKIERVVKNPEDEYMRKSISIPLDRLDCPDINN